MMYLTPQSFIVIGKKKKMSSQSTLSSLFLGVRAKKGDSIANQFLDEMGEKQLADKQLAELREILDLEVESLSMSLQMQFSRTQGSALTQMHSKHIGNQIKDIIEEGTNKLVTELSGHPKKILPILDQILQKSFGELPKSAQDVYPFVQSLNLSHDFSKIIYQIQSFSYQDIIRTLKCLVIASVFRRYKRRMFLPN